MKIVVAVLALIGYCLATSQPVIRDTKQTGKIGDRSGDFCGWEEVKLWPGESLNQPGECRKLFCTENFEIYITPCPFDISGKYKWINQDKSKLYPECCGEKVLARHK